MSGLLLLLQGFPVIIGTMNESRNAPVESELPVLDQRCCADEMLCDILSLTRSLKNQTAAAHSGELLSGVTSPFPLREATLLMGVRMSGAFHWVADGEGRGCVASGEPLRT